MTKTNQHGGNDDGGDNSDGVVGNDDGGDNSALITLGKANGA